MSASRGANYHALWAKTTRVVLTYGAPTYRVECVCGWESQWTSDWRKSIDGHSHRAQRKQAAEPGEESKAAIGSVS